MLEGVGVTAQQERIFRALLGGELDVDELVNTVGVRRAWITRDLASLQALGLVIRLPTRPARYRAAQPDIAIGALIHVRIEQLEHSRLAASQLLADFRAGVGESADGAEVERLHDFDTVKQRYIQLQLAADRDIRIVDAPPYVVTGEPNPFELAALQRGVRCRVLYSSESFEFPGKWDYARTCITAGEEARALSDVPIKMQISDATLAMVFARDAACLARAVVIHPSPLLDALLGLFDLLWGKASTLPGAADHPELTETEAAIVSLLAAGQKDEAIARLVGLHTRTVRRHVRAICAKLDAGSRFAAGARAARRGWV